MESRLDAVDTTCEAGCDQAMRDLGFSGGSKKGAKKSDVEKAGAVAIAGLIAALVALAVAATACCRERARHSKAPHASRAWCRSALDPSGSRRRGSSSGGGPHADPPFSKRVVWPRRETSCPTGASGPPRDVAGAPRLKLGAAKTVRPHADALQQSERVQARGSLRGSPSHRVAAIVRSTSEHASSYFQRAGRGRGRS